MGIEVDPAPRLMFIARCDHCPAYHLDHAETDDTSMCEKIAKIRMEDRGWDMTGGVKCSACVWKERKALGGGMTCGPGPDDLGAGRS
jgi:hypothetical protein